MRVVKKPHERRQEIISTARNLFLTKSYEETKMRDVMEKLNIAKGTIYHYFKSKEELLNAVINETVEQYVEKVAEKLKLAEGNALEKMQTLIQASDVSETESKLLESLHQPGNIGLHTRMLAVTITHLAPLYAEVIEKGCKEKLFQVEHPLECAEFLLTGMQFLTDTGCFPWSAKVVARRFKAGSHIIEALLKAPKQSFNFLTKGTH